jgi:hypothetical protein
VENNRKFDIFPLRCLFSGLYRGVDWYKSTDVSVIFAELVTLVIEAASTSETSVNFYQSTRHFNPEDSHIYIPH